MSMVKNKEQGLSIMQMEAYLMKDTLRTDYHMDRGRLMIKMVSLFNLIGYRAYVKPMSSPKNNDFCLYYLNYENILI